MRALSDDPKQTELAKGFTVADYEDARGKAKAGDVADKNRIAEAIRQRFTERYINPANAPSCKDCDPSCKHGFTMMAISCLMIEALESFRRGWSNTNGRSEAAFCYFFNTNDGFKDLRGHCEQFYKHIRCGILHQAETTGGWKVTRDKTKVPFFDSGSLTINAQCFLDNLSMVLIVMSSVGNSMPPHGILRTGKTWSKKWTHFARIVANRGTKGGRRPKGFTEGLRLIESAG